MAYPLPGDLQEREDAAKFVRPRTMWQHDRARTREDCEPNVNIHRTCWVDRHKTRANQIASALIALHQI